MRTEQDHFGEISLDDNTLHGIHTERALANFQIKGRGCSRELITAIAEIKRCAVKVNSKLGFIEESVRDVIVAACDEIATETLDYEFYLPALQGGAGTSTNMCVNEVIANRALQLLGEQCGRYDLIHPIETVNLHQSTNDVYPTALKMVVIRKLRQLSETVAVLQGEFQKKEQEFAHVLTMGRTELQDAIPITMGAQFATFAQAIERDRWRCFKAEERIRMVNLGGTAVGTGLTAPRNYIFRVIELLREETGLPIGRSEHVMDATANQDSFTEVAATLEANAVNLIKIARDLRHLHSQKEIELPELQAGSSIMPGKVNPVIAESVIQIGMRVKANTMLISDATSMGSLQINEYMPLIADTILESLDLLGSAVSMMNSHVPGITVNKEVCEHSLYRSTSIITVFIPLIGYENCEKVVAKYQEMGENRSFREFLEVELGTEVVNEQLKPAKLMALGYRK